MPQESAMRLNACAALLLASISLAGCFGGGSTEYSSSSSSSSPYPGNTHTYTSTYTSGTVTYTTTGTMTMTGTESGSSSAANASRPAEFAWTHESRTGTIDAGTAPFLLPPDPAVENFTVPADAKRLILNVSVTGAAIEAQLMPPGCTSDSCAMTADVTEDAAATFDVDKPTAGPWTAQLVWNGDTLGVPMDSHYSMDIGTLTPVGGPGGPTSTATTSTTGSTTVTSGTTSSSTSPPPTTTTSSSTSYSSTTTTRPTTTTYAP
jgi:hypothetical protein